MSTLWTYGCSYTAPYSKIPSFYNEYYEFRGGNFPPTWPELLSKKLNFDLINMGEMGSGFDTSFERFCISAPRFKPDDIIIFQIPTIERFRVTAPNGRWFNSSSETDTDFLPKIIAEYIAVDRSSYVKKKEVIHYLNFMENFSILAKVKLFIWSTAGEIYEFIDLNNRKYLLNSYIQPTKGLDKYTTVFHAVFNKGGRRILEETDGLIKDLHYGESAHRIMADLFYEHILDCSI